MSALQNIRRGNLNKYAGKLSKSGSSGLSTLNAALLEAVRVGCKMHKNTNGDVDADLLVKLQGDIDSAIAGLPACLAILQDLSDLRDNPSTVDSVISKYDVNLPDFDTELEQS